jgi:hypothetical protein
MKDDRELDELLKGMAAEHQVLLPTPGLIWWRAQILKKQREQERIERPLIVMRQLTAVLCGVFFVALLAENFGQMQTVLRNHSWFLLPLLILTTTVAVVSASLPPRSRAKR